MAEYRRGQGPDALPQGAAKGLNVRTPPAGAYQDMDIPVQFAREDPTDLEEDDSRENEAMQVLMSPPDAGYRKSLLPKGRPGRVPTFIVRNLPRLSAQARNPEAPPLMKAALNYYLWELDRERRR